VGDKKMVGKWYKEYVVKFGTKNFLSNMETWNMERQKQTSELYLSNIELNTCNVI
jgi:hypothetical protein